MTRSSFTLDSELFDIHLLEEIHEMYPIKYVYTLFDLEFVPIPLKKILSDKIPSDQYGFLPVIISYADYVINPNDDVPEGFWADMEERFPKDALVMEETMDLLITENKYLLPLERLQRGWNGDEIYENRMIPVLPLTKKEAQVLKKYDSIMAEFGLYPYTSLVDNEFVQRPYYAMPFSFFSDIANAHYEGFSLTEMENYIPSIRDRIQE